MHTRPRTCSNPCDVAWRFPALPTTPYTALHTTCHSTAHCTSDPFPAHYHHPNVGSNATLCVAVSGAPRNRNRRRGTMFCTTLSQPMSAPAIPWPFHGQVSGFPPPGLRVQFGCVNTTHLPRHPPDTAHPQKNGWSHTPGAHGPRGAISSSSFWVRGVPAGGHVP